MKDRLRGIFSINLTSRGDEASLHIGYFWLFLIGYAVCDIFWRIVS